MPKTFPILPIKRKFKLDKKPYTRVQFPLKAAFAISIHKSQSLSLKAIKLHIGENEFQSGLTYVGFSRATDFNNVSLDQTLNFSRYKKIFENE